MNYGGRKFPMFRKEIEKLKKKRFILHGWVIYTIISIRANGSLRCDAVVIVYKRSSIVWVGQEGIEAKSIISPRSGA